MTQPDQMGLLTAQVGKLGQAEVARQLGYSASAINQVVHGTYNGDVSTILAKVELVFGQSTVDCPELGEISLRKCAEMKARPFAATNPMRVALYKACKQCDQCGQKAKEVNHV